MLITLKLKLQVILMVLLMTSPLNEKFSITTIQEYYENIP